MKLDTRGRNGNGCPTLRWTTKIVRRRAPGSKATLSNVHFPLYVAYQIRSAFLNSILDIFCGRFYLSRKLPAKVSPNWRQAGYRKVTLYGRFSQSESFRVGIVRLSFRLAVDQTWTPALQVTLWPPSTSGTFTKTWLRPCCMRNSAQPGRSCLSESAGTWLRGVLSDTPMWTSNSQLTVCIWWECAGSGGRRAIRKTYFRRNVDVMWKQHGPLAPNVTAADTLLVGFPHVNLPPNSGVAKNPPALQHPTPTTLQQDC